jgi:ATP-dependent DNA ligase
MVIRINRLPAGFVIPAQPVLASRPPSGPGWVHEIKHDGHRMIVHRDAPTVRLYSRNAYDWTVRLAAIAAAAEQIKAKSFTIDGEAVVARAPRAWITVRNRASIAVERERSEGWNR